MQIHRPLKHHIEKYRHAAQSLRLWVLEVLAWWTGLFGDRGSRLYFRQCLRDARRDVRILLFLAVTARMCFQRHPAARWRPPSVRPGFRYAWKRFNPVRLCTRGIRLRTLNDIRTALESFDAIVDRALARLPKRGASGKPVAVAPPMPMHTATVFRPELAAADTS